MGFEYYYLFGLDIPLDKYGLGTIRQPILLNYIEDGINIDELYLPFIMNDIFIGQFSDKDSILKLKKQLGNLTFLLFNIHQTERTDILNTIKDNIGFIYNTKNVAINKDYTITVNDIVINNSNFDILCSIVLEMLKIDKSKLEFDKKKEILDPVTERFEMLRKQHREKVKSKKNDTEIIDMINTVIHSNECGLDYEKVLNMTIYQIKNTIEVLGIKSNYETMLQYKLSQKFDVKEDIKHWHSKKTVKNSSINRDV